MMTSIVQRAVVVTLIFVAVVRPANSAEMSQREMDFILGNFEFVLLHELAHTIIGDKDVPVLGPLESAADYVAIAMAIRGDGSESAKQFLDRALVDTASTFARTWQLAKDNDVAIPYWDNHSLSIQRYYAALCLIYGSDPEGHFLLNQEIPNNRGAGCTTEYQLADRGFQWLVDTYGRGEDQNESVEITFDYRGVATTTQQIVRDEIRRLELLEKTVLAIESVFAFEEPFTVRMRACGQPEAAWRPQNRELLVCYEMFDAFAQIYQFGTRESGQPQ